MSEKKAEKEDKTNDIDDHISKRYEMKKRLGKGAYGIVWKAVDKRSKEVVAVKKIFDAFGNQTDAQRTFREIMFLKAFKDHPNIIRLRGLHKASNNRDIYLVFDYMDTDLHRVIRKGNVLKDIHRRYIMYQLLRATRYLHSGNVIHRDQKPSNVLINAECRIKLADFGLARSLANYYAEEETEGPPLLTDYVATRWYRAPEILVASKKYTKGVDMWSLGCILGEMLLGKPLFPGSSTVNQIERIMAALPKPTPQEINNMCSGYGKGLLKGTTGPKTNLREMIKPTSEEAMDLVSKLLVFDPTKRLTASQALTHPYVSKFCNGSEICLDHNIVPPLNDDVQLSVSEYRNKLYELIANGKYGIKGQGQKATKVKTSPLDHKSMETVQKSNKSVVEGRRTNGETMIKENGYKTGVPLSPERKYRSYKNHSMEEIRDNTGGDNPIVATKSEPSHQKTDSNLKKISSSPQHRNHVPPSRTDWPGVQGKTSYMRQSRLEKQSRSADCEGDGCPSVKSSQNVVSTGYSYLSHFTSSQSRGGNGIVDKTKQYKGSSNFSGLPKVSQKKENLRHSSDNNTTTMSSFNQSHGILISSELHDIRSALKH